MKKELWKVKKGLEKRKVPYEVEELFDGHELRVRNLSGEVAFSVIYYSRSYGHNEGLLEVDGMVFREDDQALSAKETLARIDTWLETSPIEVDWWSIKKEERKEVM